MKRKMISLFISIMTMYATLQTAVAATLNEAIPLAGGGNVVLSPDGFPSLQGNVAETVKEVNVALAKYQGLVVFILGGITLTLAAIFIYLITKFAGSSDPKARAGNMSRLMICAFCIVLFGALDVIVAFSGSVLG